MIKSIIFDMDGVLLDSIYLWYCMFNRSLEKFGFKKITYNEYKKKAWSKGIRNVLPKYFPGIPLNKVVTFYEKEYPKCIHYSKVLDEPIPVLEKLKRYGFKMGIVSNTNRKILDALLNYFNLSIYFEITISSDDVKKDKPDPEGLILCIKKLKENKNNALFIGDSIYDEIAARKAKVQFIGFRRGNPRIIKLSSIIGHIGKI